jgi:hypothetical protein
MKTDTEIFTRPRLAETPVLAREQEVRRVILERSKRNEYSRCYRKAHLEALRENERRYRKANPERIKENQRLLYKSNPERFKDKTQRYRKSNPDHIKEYNRQYRKSNPEYVKYLFRRYFKTHLEALREKGRLRYRRITARRRIVQFLAVTININQTTK